MKVPTRQKHGCFDQDGSCAGGGEMRVFEIRGCEYRLFGNVAVVQELDYFRQPRNNPYLEIVKVIETEDGLQINDPFEETGGRLDTEFALALANDLIEALRHLGRDDV